MRPRHATAWAAFPFSLHGWLRLRPTARRTTSRREIVSTAPSRLLQVAAAAVTTARRPPRRSFSGRDAYMLLPAHFGALRWLGRLFVEVRPPALFAAGASSARIGVWSFWPGRFPSSRRSRCFSRPLRNTQVACLPRFDAVGGVIVADRLLGLGLVPGRVVTHHLAARGRRRSVVSESMGPIKNHTAERPRQRQPQRRVVAT